jgi:hypothetical protein
LLNSAIITGGIVEVGTQVPNFVEGLVEFRRYGGFEGLDNDIKKLIDNIGMTQRSCVKGK